MAVAAVDLCTLAQVKTYLGISDSNSDDVLQVLITAASRFANNFCSRILKHGAYDNEIYDGTGGIVMPLKQTPITVVSSVVVNTTTIPVSTSPLAYGYTYSDFAVYLRGAAFCMGKQNVAISYEAGYTDAEIPEDLSEAVIELVTLKFRSKNQIGASSRNIAGESISYTSADMTRSTRRVLNLYQRASL